MIPARPCPACGQSNDLVFWVCTACGAYMPDASPQIWTLPDGVLLAKAAEYVELAGRKGFGTTRAPRKPGGDPRRPDTWTRAELVENAEAYLAPLQARTLAPEAERTRADLLAALASARKGISGDTWVRLVSLVAFLLIGGLLVYLRVNGV